MHSGTYFPDALIFIYLNFKLSYIFFENKSLELAQKITLDMIKMYQHIRCRFNFHAV